MLFQRSTLLGVLLVSLMLTGFGCKKIDTTRPNATTKQPNSQVKLPTISVETKNKTPAPPKKRKPERQPDPEVLRIRDAMASFQKSQSYRATVTIGGPEGIKGAIAYSQQNGLYGKLSLKNGMTSDMAVFGERVAIRTGTSTWREISGTEEGAQIITLFKSITNRDSTEPIYPSDNAHYESVTDDLTRNCKMHSMKQFMGHLGGYQLLKICLKNALPMYFSIPSEDGLIEIEYRDIDTPVEVFFPIP